VPGAKKNLLLAGLEPEHLETLLAGIEPVALQAGDTLAEAGQPLGRVFFPIDSSISLALPLAGQLPLVIGLVGHEGMLGMQLLLGSSWSGFCGRVQGAGLAWRVDVSRFSSQLDTNASWRAMLGRYVHVQHLQLAQGAACRSFHRVEARLARWLLMSRDRARCDPLSLTHETLAHLLGVRRAGVTLAAHSLQDLGLIRYTRGIIQLLDRPGLEAAACPCYASDKRIYSRLMR
jgi:CRP-like cAMP-binding protein